ncbi:MAG: hypothetical protein P9L99_21770 [Candidatus Lernaella stagnicola]|nr:hypothetical protein [Candidatus Lernaella stagnicola]
MRWPWSQKKDDSAVAEYVKQRLVELIAELRGIDPSQAEVAYHLPLLQRIITLFLELGHVYEKNGQARDAAQVKAQAAKFMLVLPARQEINHWAVAKDLLGQAIEALTEQDDPSLQLADAHIVRAEYLTREAAQTAGAPDRGARRDEAKKHLLSALEMLGVLAPDAPNKAAEHLSIQTADLYNKLGNLEKARALDAPPDADRHLRAALEYFTAALPHCAAGKSDDLLALTENNLGSVRVMLVGDRADETALREAGEHFQAALRVLDRARQPHLYSMIHSNLGELALALHESAGRRKFELLQSALSHFGEAMPGFPSEQFPQQYAKILYGQGRALAAMGQKDEARRSFEEALEFRDHLPDAGRQIKERLQRLSSREPG